MYYESIYQPIVVKIKSSQKNIKFKFRSSSKGFHEFKFKKTDLSEETQKLYDEMKSLQPFGDYRFPDSSFRNMTKDFHFGYNKGQHFYNTKYMELTRLKERYSSIVKYHNVSGVVSFHDNDFFERFISSDKNYEIAFFSFSLIMSGVENFINYRERNSNQSYNDNIQYFELLHYITKQYKETPEELREKFKEIHKNVDYEKIDYNICDIENLMQISSQIDRKLDAFIFDVTLFYYPLKKFSGYISNQVIFNMLILCFQKLKKGGLMRFKIREIDNYLILEIITIVCKYFGDVYIFKGSLVGETVTIKEIVGDKFKGVDDNFIQDMVKISEKWLDISEGCGMEFTKETSRFVYSILDYDKEILPYIEKYNNLETQRKKYGFEKTINGYNYVKEYGDSAIENLLTIQLKNSVEWLKLHDIEIRGEYKIIDEKIKNEQKSLKFNEMKYDLVQGRNEEKDIELYFDKIGVINYLRRSVSLLNDQKYLSVMKKSRKITISDNKVLDEIAKIFGDDSEVQEFIMSEEKLEIIDKINNLYNQYESSYLYKSQLTIYDTRIFFVGINKRDNILNNTAVFVNFLTQTLTNTEKETERILFYYENPVILRDNRKSLEKIQKKNDDNWRKHFI